MCKHVMNNAEVSESAIQIKMLTVVVAESSEIRNSI